MEKQKLVALIPAYNEEEYLGETLDGLFSFLTPQQILVIDDGSIDETGAVARDRGVLLLSLPVNRGKGAALEAGLHQIQGEVVLFLDADLGISSQQAFPLVQPILAGEVESTMGILPPPKKRGGLGLVRFTAREGIRLLRGERVEGILSGQRAFKGELLPLFLPFAPGFGLEVGLTLDLLKHRISFAGVPLPLRHRETGNDWSGIWHRGQQLMHILMALMMKG